MYKTNITIAIAFYLKKEASAERETLSAFNIAIRQTIRAKNKQEKSFKSKKHNQKGFYIILRIC